MDFDKKEFYGIVAKAKKQMQITIDQDCNVADTKPDVEKMIQTRGIVKIQETEMMVDRVRIKGEFVFQGLYGTNDTSAYDFDQFKENKHSCIIDFFLSDHGRNERKRDH